MQYLDELIERIPLLLPQRPKMEEMIGLLAQRFRAGNKLLICGNGGSAADADHMAGELLKGFIKKRPLPDEMVKEFERMNSSEGRNLAKSLQLGFPVINLTTHAAFHTAFANDVDYVNAFAQLVIAYGRPGDVLLAISTSGNSLNILRAVTAAKALRLHTIGLTGRDGGKLAADVDCCIRVPEIEAFRIQEVHLPIYHMICLELEEMFF